MILVLSWSLVEVACHTKASTMSSVAFALLHLIGDQEDLVVGRETSSLDEALA